MLSSLDNPVVKHVKKLLADKSYRYEQREYVAEGVRVLEGLSGIKTLLVRKGVQIPECGAAKIYEVDEKVFYKLSETEHSQGVLAVAEMKILDASAIDPAKRYVLLDRLQDPGNMGTIMRSACAFGRAGVIVTPGSVDPFSPKVVRAAASALGKMDVIMIDGLSGLSGFNVIAADMKGEDLSSFLWPRGFILIIGNEAGGLSDEARAVAGKFVSIPISSCVESLNAAVSGSIILYSASQKGDRK